MIFTEYRKFLFFTVRQNLSRCSACCKSGADSDDNTVLNKMKS